MCIRDRVKIISMGDMKKVGSVGWKTVAYFLVTTAAACVIGLVFANPVSYTHLMSWRAEVQDRAALAALTEAEGLEGDGFYELMI